VGGGGSVAAPGARSRTAAGTCAPMARNGAQPRSECSSARCSAVLSTIAWWDEQQKSLPEDEVAPTLRGVVLAVLLHYLATGERMFSSHYVRAHDVDSGGRRVSVGAHDSLGVARGAHRKPGFRLYASVVHCQIGAPAVR
jgi:hypothetical protein